MPLFRTEIDDRIEKEGIIALTKVPEITRKYNRLREEVAKHNNPKHIKVTDEKLEMLYSVDEDDIDSVRVHIACIDISREIKEMLDEINNFRKNISFHNLMELIEILEIISNIISDKFEKIIKDKDFTKDEVYFSNLEHISVAEICELIDEYLITLGNIEEGLDKKKTENDKYLTEELESIEEDVIRYDDAEYAKMYLLWIFRKDDE